MNGIVIIGGGGHASSLFDTLTRKNMKTIGYVSDEKSSLEAFIDIPWLGNDESFTQNYSPKNTALLNGVGFLGKTFSRNLIYKKYKDLGYVFETIVDKTAVVSGNAILESGVQILSNSYIGPGVQIGENSIVNTGAIIEHGSKIGKNTHIAPGVTICGSNEIGSNTLIGAGAVVINDIQISDNVIVGAGSVVIKDLKGNSIVAGSPARNIVR